MSPRCTQHKARGRGSICGKTPKPDDGRNVAKCGKHRKCHTRLGGGRYCENYTIGLSQLCKGCQLAAETNALAMSAASEDLGASLSQWNGFQQERKEGNSTVNKQQQQQGRQTTFQLSQQLASSAERQQSIMDLPIQQTSLAGRMAHLTREELADFISPHIPADDSVSLASDDYGDNDSDELRGPKNIRPSPIPTGGRPLQKATKARAYPSTLKDQPIAPTAIMTPITTNQQKQHPPRSQAPPPPPKKGISGATERIRRFSGEKIAGLSSRFAHAHRHYRRRGHSGSSSSHTSHTSRSSSRNSAGAGQHRQHLPPAVKSANKNKNFTVQQALNVDLDAQLRAKMQPLEDRIDELQTTLPTATDFGIMLARLDAITAALWAVHDDRVGEYDGHRTPTGGGSGLANGLPRGERDGASRIGRGPNGVGDDSTMDGVLSWDRDEVQRSGWGRGKGKGKQELVEEEEDLFLL